MLFKPHAEPATTTFASFPLVYRPFEMRTKSEKNVSFPATNDQMIYLNFVFQNNKEIIFIVLCLNSLKKLSKKI